MVTPLRFYCLFLLTDSLFHDNDNILCIGIKAPGVEGNIAHQVLLKRDQRRKFLSLRNPVRTLGCGNPRGAAQPRSVPLPGRRTGDGETDCHVGLCPPRNHHVYTHHDKRNRAILAAWHKFDVIWPKRSPRNLNSSRTEPRIVQEKRTYGNVAIKTGVRHNNTMEREQWKCVMSVAVG